MSTSGALAPMTRRVRMTQACLAGIALGSLIAGSLPPRSYTKDLQEPYLAARALRDGIDIYTPVNELAARYFPIAADTFPHPDPHPPVLAVLSLPLTLLPFPVVVPLWLGVNLVLLVMVGRCLGVSIRASLALAAWPPLWCLLYIGQLELLILTLAVLGWRSAAAGRDGRAGVWFGVAAVLKLYPVLLLVPFAARGRIRLLLAAGAVVAAGQLVNLATVGPAGFVRYYFDVLPSVAVLYEHLGLNSSPHGALLRVFGGAADVSPIVHAPNVVLPATIAIALVAMAALALLDPEASPVAALVGLPVVWYYYAPLALPQILILLRSAAFRRATLVAVAAMSFVLPLVNVLVQWCGSAAPPMAALLAVQPAGLLAVLALSVAQRASARTIPPLPTTMLRSSDPAAAAGSPPTTSRARGAARRGGETPT